MIGGQVSWQWADLDDMDDAGSVLVWIICALAWKARCAVIMSTSDVVVSTLDSSSDPEEMLPNPEPPATPVTA